MFGTVPIFCNHSSNTYVHGWQFLHLANIDDRRIWIRLREWNRVILRIWHKLHLAYRAVGLTASQLDYIWRVKKPLGSRLQQAEWVLGLTPLIVSKQITWPRAFDHKADLITVRLFTSRCQGALICLACRKQYFQQFVEVSTNSDHKKQVSEKWRALSFWGQNSGAQNPHAHSLAPRCTVGSKVVHLLLMFTVKKMPKRKKVWITFIHMHVYSVCEFWFFGIKKKRYR